MIQKSCKMRALFAKNGFDRAENEPSKVSRKWGIQSGSDRGHERAKRRLVVSRRLA
jgi:hypothetical protein